MENIAANIPENIPMTSEMQQLVNDPNFVVEFAMGDPVPDLVPQSRDSGIKMSGVYFDKTKRYIMKNAHMSKEDVRMIDYDSGHIILVSHHPGKDPYAEFDPLGLNDSGKQHKVQGGEWESACDVTSKHYQMQNFKIRPKHMSRHGRQYIRKTNDETIMNIGKMGKLETQSMRPHFEVCKEKNGDRVYTISADMMARTFTIKNEKEEVVAQVAKTTKAMIQMAVLGSGTESTIDIASGADCSTILAIVYGLGQVGKHFIKDAVNSYVVDPVKDTITDTVVETAGLEEVVDVYTDATGEAVKHGKKMEKMEKWFNNMFKD